MIPFSLQILGAALFLACAWGVGYWFGAQRTRRILGGFPAQQSTFLAPRSKSSLADSSEEARRTVSHDLNNLLTVIQGRAELLAKQIARLKIDGVDTQELTGAISRAVSLAHQQLHPLRGKTKPPLYAIGSQPTHLERSGPVEFRSQARILVVEDERTVATLVRCVLEQAGYLVAIADSAAQALTLLDSAQQDFDLLLSDVVMAHKSGIELATEVHARYPMIKVLLMSASSLPDLLKGPVDQQTIKKLYFLQKPFSPGVLTQKVQEALQEASAELPALHKVANE